MESADTGVIAAGHPLTAAAGAEVLRAGGNAVDAAIAAILASFATESLLTGLGAGGYMLVAGPGIEPELLDFFVQAPTRLGDGSEAELLAVDVSFGDAAQVFHIGPASCGAYGMPAGICAAAERWGTMPLTELVEPALRLAREGVALNAAQAYVAEILVDLLTSTPECAALWAPEGKLLREGETIANPDLPGALERLACDGDEPFYRGDLAAGVCDWLRARGGSLSAGDLAGYRAIVREPVRVAYRDRELLTNPPPAAGGILLAYALALLDRAPAPPSQREIVAAMAAAQSERSVDFLDGLSREGFREDFLSSRLGSTTQVSVIDARGMACSTTSTNGEGSGVVVPGTGIHLNNVMGEEDLNPVGFHKHPAGRRMPSMMSPSVILRDGRVELVVGSAGSNRIRSAILQTVVAAVDRGLGAEDAVNAPRLHFQDGVVYAEPGVDLGALDPEVETVRFGALNLFFGGVQAALLRDGVLSGAGDPRRGGAAVTL
ncbi:MAG TPA: gamma-glutamyltransferase [Solirubrobacteraceae bacterium]|jgi:gamma-glutamyltranspeptidase/glutathione hydrolase|nr:gamma-glutamyltransferase [Solirubrobacteraceae bacterium]